MEKPECISRLVWDRVCKDVSDGHTLETYRYKGGWILVTRVFDGPRPEFYGHSYITEEEAKWLLANHPLVTGDPYGD